MKEYKIEFDYCACENTIIDTLSVTEILKKQGKDLKAKDAWINLGGWQSWSPCFEIEPGKRQPAVGDVLVKKMACVLQFPQSEFKETKRYVLSQFVTYLRWDDFYLCFASVPKNDEVTSPVQFIIDRKNNDVIIELADKGKIWKKGDVACRIAFFTANSYFECKDKLKELFDFGQFKQIEFLGKTAYGWESWYNHYTKINAELISEDLASLRTTQNILNITESNSKEKFPIVFQIDDGWETQVGDWTIHAQKFPNGLKKIAASIEECGYIPGLWFAPFLIYQNCPVAISHPDWLLKTENDKFVCAGLNPGWQGLKSLCVLDLSNDDVIGYLDKMMDTAINDWGFRYLKLDFLYAGMLYGKFKNAGAAFDWYDRAIKVLTKRKTTKDGKKVAYLGCGIPMEQSFNQFPLSRIGADTKEDWKNPFVRAIRWNGRNEAFWNLKATLGRAMWDKTIYAGDPDVLFIRNENCSLTRDEKILIALVDKIFASQIMYSDDPAKSNSDEEIELAKEIASIYKKIDGIEFSIKPLGNEIYKIASRDGKIKGEISLGKKHYIRLENL